MQKTKTCLSVRQGSILAYSLIILAMMIAIVTTVSISSVVGKKSASSTDLSVQAYQTADSGAQLGLKEMYDKQGGSISDMFSNCVSGAFKNLPGASGSTFDLAFFTDANGSEASRVTRCDVPVDDIRSIKSTGNQKDTVRAVSLAVAINILAPTICTNSTRNSTNSCGANALCTLSEDVDTTSNTHEYTNNCRLDYVSSGGTWNLVNNKYNSGTCKAYCISI